METIIQTALQILKWSAICLTAGFVLALLDSVFHFADWPEHQWKKNWRYKS